MFTRLDVLWKEALLSGRTLRKERSFTTLSVVLLALGIGLASAVFTLLWQAIYAQLPVPEPERIFSFSTNVTHNGRSDSDAMAWTISAPAYRYISEHFKIADGTIARHGEMVNMETPSGSRHLLADFVSGNFFDVLKVKTVIGRPIESRNDTLSDDRFVTVLSYDFWQEVYGGELAAWNSILRINGVPFRIIGIAPSGFHALIAGQSPKLYVPVSTYADLNSNWRGYDDWALRWLNPFIRLPAGATVHTAEPSCRRSIVAPSGRN